jgi:hypothetical protein
MWRRASRNVVGLGDRLAVVAAAQAVGDAPDEQRPVLQVGRLLEQGQHARLLVRLDDDERKTRLEDQGQVMKIVHDCVQSTSPP